MLSVTNKVADSVSHSPEDTLLRILRDPTSLIESVHEEYRIEDWDVDTVTQIRFNADRLKNVDWFYLDVQTPEKGEIGAYEILTPNVTPVVHNEHMRIAKACIRNRLTILARSIQFKEGVANERKSDVYRKILEARTNLTRIPEESPREAIALFYSMFDDEQQAPKCLPEPNEADYSKKAASALFRFCKMVARKYLSLVKIPGGSGLPSLVEFRSAKEFDVNRKQAESETAKNGNAAKRWIGTKKDAIKYSTFAAFPPDIRIHLRWAKRTTHYTLSAHAPDGRFFSGTSTKMSTRNDAEDLYYLAPDDDAIYFKWSLAQKETVRTQTNIYIGNASEWRHPLYLHTTHYEIPGRSVLRMIGLTALATIMMVVMRIGVERVDTTKYISAMIAVLALGIAVSPSNKDEGFENAPLLSRVTPAAVFVSLCLYIAWGLTGDMNQYWSSWGWMLPIVIVFALFLVHSWRAYRIGKDFRQRMGVVNGGTYAYLIH